MLLVTTSITSLRDRFGDNGQGRVYSSLLSFDDAYDKVEVVYLDLNLMISSQVQVRFPVSPGRVGGSLPSS